MLESAAQRGLYSLKILKENPYIYPKIVWANGLVSFSHRSNPQVPVTHDVTSEASDEEWQNDSRDDDARSTDPVERERQKHAAHSALLPGHKSLLVEPSKEEVTKGLNSSKLHRSPGKDFVTAELIRAALPWFNHLDDFPMEVDRCGYTRGSILEGWRNYYPLQEKGPSPKYRLQRDHPIFGIGQVLYLHFHYLDNLGHRFRTN